VGSVIQFLAATSSPGLTGDLKSALGSVGYGLAAIGPGIGIGLIVGQAIQEALALIGFVLKFI